MNHSFGLISFCLLTAFLALSCGSENGSSTPPQDVPPSDSRGFALAIGLNEVDPSHYDGWSGPLSGCEADVDLMQEIAESQGLSVQTLRTAQATREAVLAALDGLSRQLEPGDLLVVSYSGHGGSIPDLNGDEADDLDETWVLFNGELIDDELERAWSKFKQGVRILVFSDSCHSGTVLKMRKQDLTSPEAERIDSLMKYWNQRRVPAGIDRDKILDLDEMKTAISKRTDLRMRVERARTRPAPPDENSSESAELLVARLMPPRIMLATYRKNRAQYDELGRSVPAGIRNQVKAQVILISGCKDDQYSADLGFNGLFTWKVHEIWNEGRFQGSHEDFHEKIRDRVLQRNPNQSPELTTLGGDLGSFIGQRPYTLAEGTTE